MAKHYNINELLLFVDQIQLRQAFQGDESNERNNIRDISDDEWRRMAKSIAGYHRR
jgi:hypothetical protein